MREDLIEALVQPSAGLSGREIRTCLRLALPKPLLEGGGGRLTPEHVLGAIEQLLLTRNDIKVSTPGEQTGRTDIARKLLGVNSRSDG